MNDKSDSLADQHHLILRNIQMEDYEDVREIAKLAYPKMEPWLPEHMEALLKHFPEGQICIEDNGRVVAMILSLIVDYSKWGDRHSYYEITGNGYLTTHDPQGDTLYGMDVAVHPDYRGMRLGRRLYDARKELCQNLNLRAIVVGGRIPGYSQYKDKMTPQEYVRLVKEKELTDPVLTFQLANDFHVRKIVTNYLPEDKDSGSYATLLEWLNIYYEEKEEESLISPAKQTVRIGAVQWQMRPMKSLDDLMQQAEYFVDAVSGYQADVVLFPEFFNGPLMSAFNQEYPADAIRHLSEHTEPIRQEMVRLALAYNINIIVGSMPEYDAHELRNVSYLCRRDGSSDKQYKIHITPDEASYWGLKGGHEVRVFDTDFGKIGILICYDVEFPELPRLLADQGLQILFVPFWTDTKNAYLRVRRCAQARAIENECYVVMSGSVGNLPKVENMDMQYSQAAVFTPSDFAFPHDAIAAESTPNTEMTLICDLNLNNLKELRELGSVRNLRDRRKDLYEVRWLK